jgi:hypothetical protein
MCEALTCCTGGKMKLCDEKTDVEILWHSPFKFCLRRFFQAFCKLILDTFSPWKYQNSYITWHQR